MKGYIGMTETAREVMPLKTKAHLDEEALTRVNLDVIRQAETDANASVPVIDFADFGNGFEVLTTEQKGTLVGKPFYIVDWKFNAGDQGEFVTLFIITNEEDRYILNDGSTGIYAQMMRLVDRMQGQHAYIAVPKGLTKSDYFYKDEKNIERPATTFYLSLSR